MKRLKITFLLLLAGGLLAGCDLLETDNPNNLIEEDLNDPAAAAPMANGAEASLTRAMSAVYGLPSVASDEVTWIGSRNSWRQIDAGNVDDRLIEYNNTMYMYMSEARWTADDYIERLESFRENGALPDPRPLIRTYLYGAIARITIADVYDNFVFSDRQEAAPPIGEENMSQLYDTAVEYVNRALDLSPEVDLERTLMAVRARAKFRKGVWQKVNPAGDVNTSDPLVNSPEAAADAAAALDLMSEDYRYQLVLAPSLDDLLPPDQTLATHTNDRLELRIGEEYVVPTEDGTRVASVKLRDPIDDVVAPFLRQVINEFTEAGEYADITIVSAPEMRLIQAETALAQGDMDEFAVQINALREMSGLTPYDGQIEAIEMLKHARRVYLFLQGRRLADHYRFQDAPSRWEPGSSAAQRPGTFFPIPSVERQSNPHLD